MIKMKMEDKAKTDVAEIKAIIASKLSMLPMVRIYMTLLNES